MAGARQARTFMGRDLTGRSWPMPSCGGSRTGADSEADLLEKLCDFVQVAEPIDVQDVAAREPVEARPIPVLPQEPRVRRRREPIADATDDHEALLRQHRLPRQWTAHRQEMP